jgi:DNA processing protein
MHIVINKSSKNFPRLLRRSADCPADIYVKGDYDKKIFNNCLAVVGSRRMTAYGQEVTRKIVSEVAASGVTIVSGFMYGIDATAHETAVRSGGKTIAVMPCGINIVCPINQQMLYDSILSTGGLILSEYEEDYAPKNWMFARRNRIVAGLCQGVLIVEAASNSGSLITANFALNSKRRVFVVPGNIMSKNSEGVLELMKKSAIPVSRASDILQYYFNKKPKLGSAPGTDVSGDPQLIENKTVPNNNEKVRQNILHFLSFEPLTFDELMYKLLISSSMLDYNLTRLFLDGLVRNEGGRIYACKS